MYNFLIQTSYVYNIVNVVEYKNIFQSLINHLTISNTNEDDFINGKILELFYYLKTERNRIIKPTLPTTTHSAIITSAVQYINLHYAEKLTLESLSQIVNYSPNYFQHIFKMIMKDTPQEYITKARINQAKIFLSLPDYSIQQVSDMCGFDSQAYFSHMFKKHTGLTPKEYKTMHHEIYNDN